MKTELIKIPENKVANFYQGIHEECWMQVTSNIDEYPAGFKFEVKV